MSEELTKTKLLPIQGKDMDSIMQNLETGVAELFTSERYQEYLKTMSKFHNYSFNNTLLIAMQRPDATLVTGYRNWQSMGRQVKKGEKGITIIAPAPIKRKKEQAVLDQDQKPVIDRMENQRRKRWRSHFRISRQSQYLILNRPQESQSRHLLRKS